MPSRNSITVAIAGLGAIGLPVARRLAAGDIRGMVLTAVAASTAARARELVRDFDRQPAIAEAGALAEQAEIVVDCAPSKTLRAIGDPVVARGLTLVTVNAGALLSQLELVERAKAAGARIIVPTGALLGLDAVRGAAEGTIHAVTMVTRKPPAGLEGAPYLVERGITLAGLTEAKLVFKGSARDGAKGFPANVNVAAALSLAGIGPDRTTLEIWADPGVDRNIHRIEVEADSTRFTMQIEGVPSPENPRTGKLTPLSVIACLRGLVAPLRVGT